MATAPTYLRLHIVSGELRPNPARQRIGWDSNPRDYSHSLHAFQASGHPLPKSLSHVRPMGCDHWPLATSERKTGISCRESGNGLATGNCGSVYRGIPIDPVAAAIIAVWYALGIVAWVVALWWMLT